MPSGMPWTFPGVLCNPDWIVDCISVSRVVRRLRRESPRAKRVQSGCAGLRTMQARSADCLPHREVMQQHRDDFPDPLCSLQSLCWFASTRKPCLRCGLIEGGKHQCAVTAALLPPNPRRSHECLLCRMFQEGKHERMMTVMLTSELEVQRRLQHPLRHRYAWFTKVSTHQRTQDSSCVGTEPHVARWAGAWPSCVELPRLQCRCVAHASFAILLVPRTIFGKCARTLTGGTRGVAELC